MNALIVDRDRPSGVRFVKDHPQPKTAPGEVLIRVDLAGICSTDLEIARGYMGFEGIPGHEFVGSVVSNASKLCGQRIVGEINCVCQACDMCRNGLRRHCRDRTVLGIARRGGAFAEYLTLPEVNCHRLPPEISDQEAVFVEPLAAAVEVIKDHEVEPRTHAAVIGTGRLGLLVAQVLRLHTERLDVVGRNPRTLALASKLGLNAVSATDFDPRGQHDLVVDCTGAVEGLSLAMATCRPRGTIVLKSTYAGNPQINLAPLVIHEQVLAGSRCGPFPDAIQLLRDRRVDLIPLIGQTYPLNHGEQAFSEALHGQSVKVLLQPGT